ncbi:monovalent cation/H+ antiporter complex subunit F [Terriglobus aquaticus]|uniref:Monovalent cation/H+ antiporter complex subunit F n=1 Tax=Terriglobus aquaticus TaxID=940139 RepID=A0ABW9KI28_9BACT|nr:monovalent cation/H+ antiporter complex subunit F [Terriglobus aquaticus]
MNVWLIAGAAVSAGLFPCADMCLRGPVERRLVGMEMAAFLAIFAMVLFTIGFDRPSFMDLPLALMIMSFGGTFVFVRFIGKHL